MLGTVMEHLLVGMAEFYSRNLSREIMKGLKQRALQGHLVFGPPFGYRKEVIDRQEGYKRTRVISRPAVDKKRRPSYRISVARPPLCCRCSRTESGQLPMNLLFAT